MEISPKKDGRDGTDGNLVRCSSLLKKYRFDTPFLVYITTPLPLLFKRWDRNGRSSSVFSGYLPSVPSIATSERWSYLHNLESHPIPSFLLSPYNYSQPTTQLTTTKQQLLLQHIIPVDGLVYTVVLYSSAATLVA